MRLNVVRCDWCGADCDRRYLTYSVNWLVAHLTHDGARESWDFCSEGHLDLWVADWRSRGNRPWNPTDGTDPPPYLARRSGE